MSIQPLRAEEVIDKYSAMVYRIALTQVRSVPDAEDVFQEVFLRYVQKNPVFQSEEHRKAWLINVTLKCCKKFWSGNWFRKTAELSESIPAEMPAEEGNVYAALLDLPEKYRQVLHLFYFEDMSIDQIHLATRLKHSTIRTQLTRGRALLRKKLKGDCIP